MYAPPSTTHAATHDTQVHAALALLSLPMHWRWPAELISVTLARKAVAEELPTLLCPAGARDAERGPLTEVRGELADTVSLMTSELVTNAVTHAPTHERIVEVALWRADGMLWLAVSDCGEEFSIRQPKAIDPLPPAFPDPYADHGRGLYLVEALADVWTIIPRPTVGKSVVAGLHVP